LSNACDTSSSTTDGSGSLAGAGTFTSVAVEDLVAVDDSTADEEDDEAADEGPCSPTASPSRPLRDRPNAFRRRLRMPMCATLRMSWYP
jgi:hypothetical protein